MKNGNAYILAAGILGAVKLLLDSTGHPIITDDQVNALANGVAALAAILAAYTNNHKAKGEETK